MIKEQTTKCRQKHAKMNNSSYSKNCGKITTSNNIIENKDTDKYYLIPKNLIPVMENELINFIIEDDDLKIINKIIFSLKDPFGFTKIKLPVKSSKCVHFSCFDFENFCTVNSIPKGIQKLQKKILSRKGFKNLILLNEHSKKKKCYKTKTKVEFKNFPEHPKVPKYKCPLCNIEFSFSMLSISNTINFFIKKTSNFAEKIEIINMRKYKVYENKNFQLCDNLSPQIINLSDDEKNDINI